MCLVFNFIYYRTAIIKKPMKQMEKKVSQLNKSIRSIFSRARQSTIFAMVLPFHMVLLLLTVYWSALGWLSIRFSCHKAGNIPYCGFFNTRYSAQCWSHITVSQYPSSIDWITSYRFLSFPFLLCTVGVEFRHLSLCEIWEFIQQARYSNNMPTTHSFVFVRELFFPPSQSRWLYITNETPLFRLKASANQQ